MLGSPFHLVMLIVRFLAPLPSLPPVASAFPVFRFIVTVEQQFVELSLTTNTLEVVCPPQMSLHTNTLEHKLLGEQQAFEYQTRRH